MAKSQKATNFGNVIEEIVFKDVELEALKVAVRNLSKGIITPKQLKQNLLNCRSRIAKEVLAFLNFTVDSLRINGQNTINNNFTGSDQIGLENDRLRQKIAEREELLEIVAKRIGGLVAKAEEKPFSGTKSSSVDPEDLVKIEIKRVFSEVKAKEWLEMCEYDNYKFFVKLYPQLEELYNEQFGESEENNYNKKDGKNIMANKMLRLGFPEEVEDLVVQYIVIRNSFNHSMKDISPSNLELTREAFVEVFVYLIVSNLDSKLVSSNRETFYSYLTGFFSEKLKDNPIFREKILERLKTVFNA